MRLEKFIALNVKMVHHTRMEPKLEMKNNLREWRTARGIPPKKLAELVQTSEANLSRIENGLQQPRLGLLARIVAVFDKEPGDFYKEGSHWTEAVMGMHRIQVMSEYAPENKLKPLEKPFLAVETDDPEDLFGFYVNDAAMGPELRLGDAVIAKHNRAPEPNDLVVAVHEEKVLVRCYRPISGDVYALIPVVTETFNNIYSDRQAPEICGTVVEIRRYRAGWLTDSVKIS